MRIALSKGREQLTSVVQASGDVITVDSAAQALDLNRTKAAKTLARWTDQGWLRRVGHGIYIAATMDTLDKTDVLSDPWILIPALFSDASYVGGRTAAEHWDLTEQIFRDIVVFTTRSVRKGQMELQGGVFTPVHVSSRHLFGTTVVWRGQTRVKISDIHRTIVDMLAAPEIGGGMQHVNDCLRRYLSRKDFNLDAIFDYADALDNSVIFKRLGFLTERIPGMEYIAVECLPRVRSGLSPLDPSQTTTRINTKWNLRVPKGWRDDGG